VPPLPHAASVPRPVCHGTGAFTNPAWRGGGLRHAEERPSSRFRGITSPSKRVRQMVYYLVSATDLEQAEAGVLEMGRTWWPSLKREDDRHR